MYAISLDSFFFKKSVGFKIEYNMNEPYCSNIISVVVRLGLGLKSADGRFSTFCMFALWYW
jgi:hypothetical protein